MQLSRYTIFVDDYPAAGSSLAYNTRTQSLIKVDDDLKSTMKLASQHSHETSLQDLRLKQLLDMGVMVRDDQDEEERFARFMEQKKYGIRDAFFTATILTTYSCNMACTYCFEESTRETAERLNRHTSELIVSWLQRKLKRHRIRDFILNFYGGEPLLNRTELEFLAGRMKEWCESQGIRYRMMMQTNGVLLTADLVSRYKTELGMFRAKISLDGTREHHDQQRPMRGSGAGTFDTIIKNMSAASEMIEVVVAAGYDKADPSGVIELIDYMDSIKLLRKLENFQYSPIHPGLGPRGHMDKIVSPGCMSNYDTDHLLRAEKRIKEHLAGKGFGASSGLSIAMCPVTSGDYNVTIDTHGSVFKCGAMLGHRELAVGTIFDDEYNERHKRFMDADQWKKCDASCPYAPMCNTGCRLFAFFKHKDFDAKSCEKSYMDKFVPEGIKMEYRARLQNKSKTPSTATLMPAC